MRRVWIDTDLGFDDLAAVMMARAHLDVAGLSLVAGNAPFDALADSAARAASFLGWTMPIHRGRAKPLIGSLATAASVLGETGLPTVGRALPAAEQSRLADGDAVAALARFVEEETEPPALLALGPLTNLAVLLLARPDLAGRVGEIVWMGGSAGAGNHTAAAEFNAAVDPEAAQVVLESGVPLRMVGLDLCRRVRIGAADVAAVRSAGGERARTLADLFEAYLRIAGPDPAAAMALYDPVAAAALIDPAAVRFAPAHVDVERSGVLARGMTVVEFQVPGRAAANAAVAVSADPDRIRVLLVSALRDGGV